MLLLLDNFEQLLPVGGADLLAKILEAAPGMMMVVTSREVLNLREEWLYSVPGLPVPEDSRPDEWQSSSAVQLFSQHARRVNRGFSITAELPDLVRICQLTEGMPLAIELAAAWTRTLSCATTAAEIQGNCDFLASNARNMPNRQRSMRAVFEHSWRLLSNDERQVFGQLSVFRGSFHRDAAKQVAGASLATLLALVDKSLLRADENDRYHMHELLRQYAAEQLANSPDEVAYLYDRHCAYYTEFLAQRAGPRDPGPRPGHPAGRGYRDRDCRLDPGWRLRLAAQQVRLEL